MILMMMMIMRMAKMFIHDKIIRSKEYHHHHKCSNTPSNQKIKSKAELSTVSPSLILG